MKFWCFVIFVVAIGCVSAYPGEYLPKSYFTIDENGQDEEKVYIDRDLIERYRRSAAGGAVSYGGSFGNGGYGGGYGSSGRSGYDGGYAGNEFAFNAASPDIAGIVDSGLANTFNQLKSFADEASIQSRFAGGGGRAYSGSFSSGGSGNGQQGAVLHSRFADTNGGFEKEIVTAGDYGIQSSASAQGPHGAFSFSSSSTDENGKVNYQTRARQY